MGVSFGSSGLLVELYYFPIFVVEFGGELVDFVVEISGYFFITFDFGLVVLSFFLNVDELVISLPLLFG